MLKSAKQAGAAILLGMFLAISLPLGDAIASTVPAAQTTSPSAEFNVPYCSGVQWSQSSSTQVRVFATGSTIRQYIGHPRVGLVWTTVHRPDGSLRYSGAHNASSTTGTDFRVPGRTGDQITISISDDDNTRTLCPGWDTI